MAREKSARLSTNKYDPHKGAYLTPLYASGVGHAPVTDGTPKSAIPSSSSSVNDHLPKGGKLLKSGGMKKGR